LIEAIVAVRGGQERTVRRWLEESEAFHFDKVDKPKCLRGHVMAIILTDARYNHSPGADFLLLNG